MTRAKAQSDSRKGAKHANGKHQGADKSISTIHRRDAEYAEEILIAQSGDDDWAKPKRFKGDMFLFVVVSRQTKKEVLCVLCVSAVKSPNPYLRKSALICG